MKKYFVILLILLNSNLLFTQNISDTIQLKEVEIISKKESPLFNTITIYPDLKPLLGVDVIENLKKTAQVSVIRRGGASFDPVIRGFKNNQLSISINNGYKFEGGCPNRMDPVLSHIETEDVEKIEVVKHAALLQYGSYTGGMINAITFLPDFKDKIEVSGSVNSFYQSNWDGIGLSGKVYIKNKYLSIKTFAGKKVYGNYKDGFDNTVKTSFIKEFQSAYIAIKPLPKSIIQLSFIHNKNTNSMFPALPMDQKNDDAFLYALNYNQSFGKILNSFSIDAYKTTVEHDMDNELKANFPSMQAYASVKTFEQGILTKLRFKINKLNWNTGVNYVHIFKDGTRNMYMKMLMEGVVYTSKKNTNLWNNANIQQYAWWNELNYKLNKFEFFISSRIEKAVNFSTDTFKITKTNSAFNKTHDKWLYSFNLSSKYHINDNLQAIVSLKSTQRNADLLETYIKFMPISYDNYDYIGNPYLKPERNNEIDFSIDYQLSNKINAHVTYYYAYIQDYISAIVVPPSVATPKTTGVIGVKQFENINNARLQGFEVFVDYKLNKFITFSQSAFYTFGKISKSEMQINSGVNIIDTKVIENDNLSEIPPFESLTKATFFILKNKLMTEISIRCVAPQNNISVSMYESKTPGFVIVDYAINYKIVRYFTLFGGINNVLNKPYYEHLNRRQIGTTKKLYEPGRFFTIGAKINF